MTEDIAIVIIKDRGNHPKIQKKIKEITEQFNGCVEFVYTGSNSKIFDFTKVGVEA